MPAAENLGVLGENETVRHQQDAEPVLQRMPRHDLFQPMWDVQMMRGTNERTDDPLYADEDVSDADRLALEVRALQSSIESLLRRMHIPLGGPYVAPHRPLGISAHHDDILHNLAPVWFGCDPFIELTEERSWSDALERLWSDALNGWLGDIIDALFCCIIWMVGCLFSFVSTYQTWCWCLLLIGSLCASYYENFNRK